MERGEKVALSFGGVERLGLDHDERSFTDAGVLDQCDGRERFRREIFHSAKQKTRIRMRNFHDDN